MRPTLSVVLTCFAEGDLLLEAVASVLNQSVQPDEIIVVQDGGATTATRQACDRLDTSAGIRLIERRVNGGTSASRNTGVGAATGEIIVPLDADDTLPESALETIRDGFVAAPGADFIAGPHWEEQYGHRVLRPAGEVALSALLAPVRGALKTNWTLLGTSPLKRSLWQSIGGYDETFGVAELHDVEFWIRALAAAHDCCRTTAPIYTWRRRAGSNMSKVTLMSWGRLAETHFATYKQAGLEFRARELLVLSSAVSDRVAELKAQRAALMRLVLAGKARPLSAVVAAMPGQIIRTAASAVRR